MDSARAKKVAALYDIHANLSALEAVLEEISDLGVDVILIGGDVAWGPRPTETVRLLRGLDEAVVIRGNADREVGTWRVGSEEPDDPVGEINTWCSAGLSDDDRQWLVELPETAVLDIEGLGPTLFCHGSPRSDEEILTAATPESRLVEATTSVDEAIVVGGHTHMQFDRTVSGVRVVNAGSVGLPYEDELGAYWALLGPDVDLRRTTYDVDDWIKQARASGCPHVEEFFVTNFEKPPGRTQITEQFEAMARRDGP